MNTAVVLPSGRFTATAAGDITLYDNARLDLSGRRIEFFDVSKYSWGGDFIAESTHGNIVQTAGSIIDVSAQNNDAGVVQLTATDAAAGRVLLNGTLRGQGGAQHEGGSLDIRAQLIGGARNLTSDFAALNAKLNEAGFFGLRSFVLKQGDLVIGDGVKAREVSVSVDGGSLTVNGRIDASGEKPGTIRLAARDDLVIGGSAVLDVHGRVLQVDSTGAPIEAKNRGHVELTSRDGWLRLNFGASFDLASPDNVARGKIALNAGRTAETSGDIRIEAGGPVNIAGAGEIALNAFWRYDLPGGSVIDQALLDGYDAASSDFILAAYNNDLITGVLNTTLQGRIAGLSAYGGAFHLRPGIEIASTGALTVDGDIDLSGYRYGPNADRDTSSATYRGEAGSFVIRAAGDLAIKGSINDGFAPPAATPNDLGFPDRAIVVGAPGYLATSDTPLTENITIIEPWTVPSFTQNGDYIYHYNDWGGATTDGNWYWPGQTVPAGSTIDYSYQVVEYGSYGVRFVWVAGVQVPATGTITPGEGRLWAASPLLAAGSQSWSIRLVSGADSSSASTRALQARSVLDGAGNLMLRDLHVSVSSGAELPSVIRTGIGDLDLLAGGDFKQNSLYGIYTAGTSMSLTANNAGYDSLGYHPDHGGDLRVTAQGDLSGYATTTSGNVGNWLWRQTGDPTGVSGYLATLDKTLTANVTITEAWTVPAFTGDGNYIDLNNDWGVATTDGNWYYPGQTVPAGSTIDYSYQSVGYGSYGVRFAWFAGVQVPATGGSPTPTAYAINFGTYIGGTLHAFAGFGALGGGNVTLKAGGDARGAQCGGRLERPGDFGRKEWTGGSHGRNAGPDRRRRPRCQDRRPDQPGYDQRELRRADQCARRPDRPSRGDRLAATVLRQCQGERSARGGSLFGRAGPQRIRRRHGGDGRRQRGAAQPRRPGVERRRRRRAGPAEPVQEYLRRKCRRTCDPVLALAAEYCDRSVRGRRQSAAAGQCAWRAQPSGYDPGRYGPVLPAADAAGHRGQRQHLLRAISFCRPLLDGAVTLRAAGIAGGRFDPCRCPRPVPREQGRSVFWPGPLAGVRPGGRS